MSKLAVPLYVNGSIVVPNPQPQQKSAIHHVCRKMVASVAGPSWEKQALNKAVRMVRSNPKTVHRIFETTGRQFDKLPSQPRVPATAAVIYQGHTL